MSETTPHHPEFELVSRRSIETLGIELQEYRHPASGARHFHMSSEDDNNVFLVAFLTVPDDSTGVAHILEHTSLCGSERFPVRDPFFMMTRRSLNTFMNAFTSTDWTAYPFASQCRKDFDNLLDVYLDAVFFPRLDELDFLQEGHRLEFAEADNPDSELLYKGVVFNEMKGAMSSPLQTLWMHAQSQMFPSITYHHNYGGDPQRIPDLSWQQLKDFHAEHYHPSNAIFMTYGNFPVAEHQLRIHDQALARFEARDMSHLQVPDEKRRSQPLTAEASYALDEEDLSRKTHIVVGWLLGNVTDPLKAMQAHLLSGVLLDNSSSPLRLALETTELGQSPSDLCGLDDSTREMTFYAGVDGSDPEHAAALESLVLRVLQEVVDNDVPQEQIDAVLHQIELSQREITGGGYPYGLRLITNALGSVIHGGDALEALDIGPVLDELRAQTSQPGFIPGLIRELFLDNPHRLRLTMSPDGDLAQQQLAEEKARLQQIQDDLDEAGKARVVRQALELAERQATPDDPELLPKVGLEDVPAGLKIAQGQSDRLNDIPLTRYAQGTNGMVYQQLVVDLPSLDEELLDLLPLYTSLITEVGCGELDYLQAQARQAAVTGSVSARLSVRGEVDDVGRSRAYVVLFGKALARNHQALTQVLFESFTQARFDELQRIRELVTQQRMGFESAIVDRGHVYAMICASAGLSPSAKMSQQWNGLDGLQRLKALDDALEDDAHLQALVEQLKALHEQLLVAPRQLVLIGEAEHHAAMQQDLAPLWTATAQPGEPSLPTMQTQQIRQAWAIPAQVNFCAKVYPTVAIAHKDSAALMVLGEFLRNGFLHTAIREQGGAYGAGAGYDSDSAGFRFYSYRDPRLAQTLDSFDESLNWLQACEGMEQPLEEAILGVIASLDRPDSPAGEAVSAFFGDLHGRDATQRGALRNRVLAVTLADLKRVASQYLRSERASVAVLGDKAALESSGLKLEICSV